MPPLPRPAIAGADGCKAGWIAVRASVAGGSGARGARGTATAPPVEHALCPDIAALLAWTAGCTLAIDIPIGLSADGARGAEASARAVLGARRSSVFNAPPRAVLGARNWAEANAISRRVSGKGLSQQTFHITAKIAAVDAALRADARAAARVVEVHPEVCFTLLHGGTPMRHPKRTRAGHAERSRLVGQEFPGAFDAIRAAYRAKDVASDDILDALVTLWSARRIRAGTARAFPAHWTRDAHGLPMVIHA